MIYLSMLILSKLRTWLNGPAKRSSGQRSVAYDSSYEYASSTNYLLNDTYAEDTDVEVADINFGGGDFGGAGAGDSWGDSFSADSGDSGDCSGGD